jgi:DNA-binding response OmpR family regulator
MLPDTDGLILTTALKTLTNAPIITCIARHEQVDRVLGLKLGADDLIAKPFEVDELEARIEAVLRRASRVREMPGASADQIRIDEQLISQSRGTVTLAGQPASAPDADGVSPARAGAAPLAPRPSALGPSWRTTCGSTDAG